MNPWDPEQLKFDRGAFSGVARLFPLPGLVAFPHTVQQLHIFEPRYRAMTEDALDSDGLIALALLKPGWESDVAGRPPLLPHACLGKIIAHHRLDDGRFNLLLLGVSRVRLVEEVEPPIAFRRARVELLEETLGELSEDDEARLCRRLGSAMRARIADGPAAEQIAELLDRDPPLAVLTDLAGYTLGVPEPVKQQLLAEPCAAARATRLLEVVGGDQATDSPSAGEPGEQRPAKRGFPPPFSVN
ncbi:MAG: LON peptidase substrate-binding domain-containing protein [Planctomycetota bacterium]